MLEFLDAILFTSDMHSSQCKRTKQQGKVRMSTRTSGPPLFSLEDVCPLPAFLRAVLSEGLFSPWPCLPPLLPCICFCFPSLTQDSLQLLFPHTFEHLPLGLHGSKHLCFGIEIQRRGDTSINEGLCTGGANDIGPSG